MAAAPSRSWRARYACAETCALSTSQLNEAAALVASYAPPLAGRVYLIERGDHLVVLRYSVGLRPPATSWRQRLS